MKKFLYTSANPCHTSLTINKEVQHISMYEGCEYELPQDDAQVKRLEAQGLLKPLSKTIIQKTKTA